MVSAKHEGQVSDADVRATQMLDIRTIACRLDVCEKTVRRIIARGDLRAYRIGRQLRISEEDYMRYLEHSQKQFNAYGVK